MIAYWRLRGMIGNLGTVIRKLWQPNSHLIADVNVVGWYLKGFPRVFHTQHGQIFPTSIKKVVMGIVLPLSPNARSEIESASQRRPLPPRLYCLKKGALSAYFPSTKSKHVKNNKSLERTERYRREGGD